MRKSDIFVLGFSKALASLVRLLLRVRYRIIVRGADIIEKQSTILFLPNHQALIDPMIILSHIYRYSTAIPVISAKYYDIPVAQWYFRRLGAVRVSDLERGSRDTRVLKTITRSVLKGFRRKKNILIYPAGQIAAQGYEKIINKKSAYQIVLSLPGHVQIIGVRITGLWGSIFSKAKPGKPPVFFLALLKGFFFVLMNLVLFLPKRNVTIEFEDLTKSAKEKVLPGQKEFNAFLEEFYNLHGEEQALFLRHIFYFPHLKR